MKYQILDKNNNVIYETEFASDIFFYGVMFDYNGVSKEDMPKAMSVVTRMYSKDSNHTPMGHLADYVAKHFERLYEMSSVWDQLSDFYDNYENVDEEDEEI